MNVQSLQFIMFCSPGLRGSKSGLRGTVSVVNADTATRAAARTIGSRCHHSGRSDGDHRDRGRGSHIASGNRDSRGPDVWRLARQLAATTAQVKCETPPQELSSTRLLRVVSTLWRARLTDPSSAGAGVGPTSARLSNAGGGDF